MFAIRFILREIAAGIFKYAILMIGAAIGGAVGLSLGWLIIAAITASAKADMLTIGVW